MKARIEHTQVTTVEITFVHALCPLAFAIAFAIVPAVVTPLTTAALSMTAKADMAQRSRHMKTKIILLNININPHLLRLRLAIERVILSRSDFSMPVPVD